MNGPPPVCKRTDQGRASPLADNGDKREHKYHASMGCHDLQSPPSRQVVPLALMKWTLGFILALQIVSAVKLFVH
jgi:hypothetical protein